MPSTKDAEPIYREDDRELLGYVHPGGGVWNALTTFGYEFASTATKAQAVSRVERDGLTLLAGVWQYYDKDTKQWQPCVIKKVLSDRVVVVQTNELGYEDITPGKRVTIVNPDATNMSAPL